ncbi:hypothetical protein Despr_1463 [Desulfobulbus propionicus DSM 2032]|uniref:Uncharacterized protein n=1 Tax=Desulfobulbus propionicus (strain ATCC 33891 / DSM 2032 / VKM B-1956 / 1pr3) TaxID=577650 RepID=A0A7U3YLW5_DESPD|nr:hypothetical protein [Desulfobulbus propionicus]ADW17618.1 hypothetical protein Despr_1463 [Desulfobulbus propionicus DSM 2032]
MNQTEPQGRVTCRPAPLDVRRRHLAEALVSRRLPGPEINTIDGIAVRESIMNVVLAILFCAIIQLMTMVGTVHAGVSISVGEPGFYGRIDIGGYPAPRLIYEEPIVVRRVTTWYPPIYLRVPPGHVKQWYRYCDRYGACGRPVYFIDDGWYNEVYVPRHRQYHPRRVVAPPPPVIVHEPRYYEYKKYKHKPPKKVYVHKEYRDNGKRHDHDRRGDDRRGGGRHR